MGASHPMESQNPNYLCILKLERGKLSKRLSRLYQNALLLGVVGSKREFRQLQRLFELLTLLNILSTSS